MKFFSSIILLLMLLLGGASSARAQKSAGKGGGDVKGRGEGKQSSEQTVQASETVNVMLATGAGNIIVRGWDRKEVHARSKESNTKIELRKSGGATDASSPAGRVEVRISIGSADDPNYDESDSPISLDVPRGATVFLKSQDGDVDVEGVAEVHVEAIGGRVEVRRVSKAIEATSVGSDVTLEDSSGRARLSSLSGSIEVKNFSAQDASDFLKTKTMSGDILFDRVGTAHIEAGTISGVIKFEGPLARGGAYLFSTTTGDMTLVLPADSSFNLNARVSEGGEIVTEFPLTYKGATSPLSHMHAGHLSGTYGSGDATINLISFSGTIRLRKK